MGERQTEPIDNCPVQNFLELRLVTTYRLKLKTNMAATCKNRIVHLIIRVLIIQSLHVVINSEKDSFTEELFIKPLSIGYIYSHFQFTTKWNASLQNPSTCESEFIFIILTIQRFLFLLCRQLMSSVLSIVINFFSFSSASFL